MRTYVLIDKTGAFVNGDPELAISSVDLGVGTMFANQITLEFFNEIELNPQTQQYEPVYSSIVTSGLSGTVSIAAKATQYAPYNVELSEPDINIANSCMLQFTGICQYIAPTCTDVAGAEYIRLVIDRN